MRPRAWASSAPGAPCTVTQNTPSMGVLALEKIAVGEVGSPLRMVTRGSEARAWALADEGLRVSARMRIGVVAVERRADTTELP